jgi:hypothetical protein
MTFDHQPNLLQQVSCLFKACHIDHRCDRYANTNLQTHSCKHIYAIHESSLHAWHVQSTRSSDRINTWTSIWVVLIVTCWSYETRFAEGSPIGLHPAAVGCVIGITVVSLRFIFIKRAPVIDATAERMQTNVRLTILASFHGIYQILSQLNQQHQWKCIEKQIKWPHSVRCFHAHTNTF